MKILKISLKNINSLRGEHHIDFTVAPLKDNSLFAITGPTGSGKSTILDVISLALFTIVPRLGRITKNAINDTGAILTKNQQDAYASVTYSCTQGVFQSTWSISTARTGALRDYEMQLKDVGSGKELPLKKSEVPAQNEAFIGLNYEQFIKSVVLAQGEFAQFLKVPKKERSELLEKITGTSIYRLLGARAYEKNKQESEQIKEQQVTINYLIENLIDEEDFKVMNLHLKQFRAEKATVLIKLEKLKLEKTARIELTAKRQEITRATASQTQQKELQQTFLNENGSKLAAHEQTQSIARELIKWEELQENITSKKENLETAEANKITVYADEETYLSATGKFIRVPIHKTNTMEELEAFRKKVTHLDDTLKSQHAHYKQLKTELDGEIKPLNFPKDLSPEELQIKIHALKSDLVERLEKVQPIVADLDLEHSKEEELRLDLDVTKVQKALRQQGKTEVLQRDVSITSEEISQLKIKQAAFPNQLETLGLKQKIAEGKRDTLKDREKNKQLTARLEDLRNDLVADKPCPLCGALHHPYADYHELADDELELEIKENSTNLMELQNSMAQIKANAESVKQDLAKTTQKNSATTTELEQMTKSFRSDFEGLPMDSIALESRAEKLKKQTTALKSFLEIQIQKEAIDHSEVLIPQLQLIKKEGIKSRSALKQIYQGTDIYKDINRLKSEWNELLTRERLTEESVATNSKDLVQFEEELKCLSEQLEIVVVSKDFSSIKKAAEARIQEEAYQTLRKLREQFHTEQEGWKAKLETLQEQIGLLLKKEPQESLDWILEEFKKSEESLKALEEKETDLSLSIRTQQESLARIESIQAKIQKQENNIKRWRLLNELIGDFTGNKFNDFAQDLTLSRLLSYANVRMRQLSDRYTIDKSMPDEDDSLIAIDDHMGGQRRSVKTLSGGETFVMSLALALALSDLASRKVRIESMFIDEGFGTLDPETLDQTMDTLEKLQSEAGKTIGVISHVESLKERIQTQVVLKRDSHGYSTLEVI
jgi:exonuclease SbcC